MRRAAGVAGLLCALAAPSAAEAVIVQKLWPLAAHADPEDAPGTALDVRAVSFGMRGTRLARTVRTFGEWDADAVGPDGICVGLSRGGDLCLASTANGGLQLRRAGRSVPAEVERPDRRSVKVAVHPRALGLGPGRLRWSLSAGQDRAPDAGTLTSRVAALGGPRCFGAGARAGRHPCVDRDLRREVIPGPYAAQVTPDFPCERAPGGHTAIGPCRFGYPHGRPRIALIGDSHAAHWRAAVDVAAKVAGRRAVSLTSPGCSFSTEVYPAPTPIPAGCRAHTREALRWLRRHRGVDTVITSSSAGRGLSTAGYRSVWSLVPRSVRRILVIRDVPRVTHATAGCVAAVKRRGASSVGVCSVPRAGALPPDTSAQAAAGAGGRVRLLDFTRFFCGRSRCYPVIGGAYVYRDFNHMNPVFGSTLGPYLLRALR